MKKLVIFILAVFFLQFGCAVPTDLHVKTDDFFGASNDLTKDIPALIIYDEATFYNTNNLDEDEATKK